MNYYHGDIEPECRELCDAINLIPGLVAFAGCNGHDQEPFRVWFYLRDRWALSTLPSLLYYLAPRNAGFYWTCEVFTDRAMSAVKFMITSKSIGEAAYREAQTIAAHIRSKYECVSTDAEISI